MQLPTSSRALIVLLLTLTAAARVSADVVETKNGARIVGKVTKIDAGTVEVATDFAGELKIKQSEVTAITTDAGRGSRGAVVGRGVSVVEPAGAGDESGGDGSVVGVQPASR